MSEWLEIKDPDIETIANVITSILVGAIKENENLCPCCVFKATLESLVKTAIISEVVTMEEVANTICEAMNDLLPSDDVVH